MPIYEYECQQCRRHTEKRQKFSDPEITECPHCGGPLQRVISAPAFSFAGGGWYKDLYSSNKPPAAGNGSAESKADTGSSSETKSDSKSGDSTAGAKKDAPPSSPAPAAAAAAPSASSGSEKK